MADELEDLLETIRRENAAAHEETRRHFEMVGEDVRRDVRAVAEGVAANTDRIDAARSEMKREFADMRSLI